MQVRRLRAADIALHREVMLLYSAAFEEPGSYRSAPPDDAYIAALLARPDFIELAAFAGGELAGALSAYALPKFEQARAEVYIYDLAVLEAHRRKGVASALIEALKPIAREAGAWVIFVQADHGDEPAIALYESLGSREEVLHFDIAL
jgi:aminoglycoside 3-N-acetyltransferase I